MSREDKRKWFYVVVDVKKETIEICQTKEEVAESVGVHPNTVKFVNDMWIRSSVDKTTRQIVHFITAKRFVEPNKNKDHYDPNRKFNKSNNN